MKLVEAKRTDIDLLMSWFPTEQSVAVWGGPKFRYPFTPETFIEDSHWKEMASYCLQDSAQEVLAFGQIYERHGRINLARLAVSPDRRRRGNGRQLVTLLLDKGRETFSLTEFSLYVYKDNYAAIACYKNAGFDEHEYPPGDEMADACFYMTRPI